MSDLPSMSQPNENFGEVAKAFRDAVRPIRYEWTAKVGGGQNGGLFQGTSTAFSSCECAQEVAMELVGNELGEEEVWPEVVITVRFRVV